jgi:hypothetical protein
MPRKPKRSGAKQSPKRSAAKEEAAGRVIERPDGFYRENAQGEMVGPYATLAEAEADVLADGAANDGDGADSLQEAESEVGISEWIDPDTGGPAEDNVPRLEDH